MIKIESLDNLSTNYVNPSQITSISTGTKSTDGYVWKETYFINIFLTDGHYVEYKTYDKEEYNSLLNAIIYAVREINKTR